VKKLFPVLFILLLLMLATAATLPFWFGMEVEKNYNNKIQQLSKRGITLTPVNYRRGWFVSSAESTIVFPGLPFTFSAAHRISHGPFALDRILSGEYQFTPVQGVIKSQVSFAPPAGAAANSPPPLEADTIINIQGDGETRLRLASVKNTLANGDVFESKEASGTVAFNSDWKKLQVNLLFPQISLKTQNNNFILSKLDADSNLQEGVAGYMFGTNSFQIEKMAFAENNVLEGLRMITSARETGTNVSLVMQYSLKGATLAGETYGPAQVAVEIRKLDAATLVKLDGAISEIYKKQLPEAQAGMILTGKMLEIVADLAKKNPEMEVTKFNFKTQHGEITGKVKLALDGANINAKENPLLLINALSGEGEVSVPSSIMEAMVKKQIQQEIERLKTSGKLKKQEVEKLTPEKISAITDQLAPQRAREFAAKLQFVPNGANFQANASLKRGQLFINNQPFHPSVKLP
jgi:uncharacterized protein YdgA (DUF945 family)